ncbi:hypothetical protein LMBIIBHN_04320 [Aeromonas salmonicida]
MMAEMEAVIQRLWRQLPQIRAFAFEASNGAGSATDWCGRGEGDVEVTDHQGGWLTAEPHLCGQDHYSAELTESDSGFLLSWEITGPRKNERLSYRYLR